MTTKTHRKAFIWLLCLTSAYGAILTVITVMNWFGADNWWFGDLNLFLPQAIWVVPGVFLTIFYIKVNRRWVWVPLLGLAWVLGPIMGLCWPLHTSREPANSLRIRVMTWNVKYGRQDALAPFELINNIDLIKPDVVLMQDAQGLLCGLLGDYFRKWNVQSSGQYIIASRLPLSDAEVRFISFPGFKEKCLRCQMHIGTTVVTLYNVHFESPRDGLDAFKSLRQQPWYLPEAIQQLENNVYIRLFQARAIREFISQEKGPVIVAGDFNSSDASKVCITLRDAGLHDAFAEGGRGYGYTYGHYLLQHRLPWLRASWMRIDHIMISSQLQSRRSWTGTWQASAHRPVIADLLLKNP
jgi:endonuclease/exonuclease/phosphatase family metal-dependent hydrolase